MKYKSVGRLALFSAVVLGIAACERNNAVKVLFIDKGASGGTQDSVVCRWSKVADSTIICTRYYAGGSTRNDTSGLGQ